MPYLLWFRVDKYNIYSQNNFAKLTNAFPLRHDFFFKNIWFTSSPYPILQIRDAMYKHLWIAYTKYSFYSKIFYFFSHIKNWLIWNNTNRYAAFQMHFNGCFISIANQIKMEFHNKGENDSRNELIVSSTTVTHKLQPE